MQTDAMIAWLTGWLPAGATGAWAAGALAILCFIVGLNIASGAVSNFMKGLPENEKAEGGAIAVLFNWVFPALWAVVFLALAVIFATVVYSKVDSYWDWVLAYASVFFFGGAVGAAELVSRYRDSPTRALWTMPGFFYIFLNAIGSLGALYLIYVYRQKLNFADDKGDWLPGAINLVQAVLLAGFSSLLFFRTSIFKFRVGESDLAIGPAIVLDTLLSAADRAVDRVMASPRAAFVQRVMKFVIFEKAAAILPGHSLSLMQNVSSAESQRIASVVNQLRTDKETPDRVKVLNLGLALLSVVGEKVLETAVTGLQNDLEDSTARLIEEVGDVMVDVSFATARMIVPPYCFAISMQDVPEEAKQKLAFDMKALEETLGVPEAYKVLRLGIGLARLTNGAIVRKALKDLAKEIRRALPSPTEQTAKPAEVAQAEDPAKTAASTVSAVLGAGPSLLRRAFGQGQQPAEPAKPTEDAKQSDELRSAEVPKPPPQDGKLADAAKPPEGETPPEVPKPPDGKPDQKELRAAS